MTDDRCRHDLATGTCVLCPRPEPDFFDLLDQVHAAASAQVDATVVDPEVELEVTHTAVVVPLRKVKPVDLSTNRDAGLTLHDYVVELCEFTTQRQPYTRLVTNSDGTNTTVTEHHRTTSTSLLTQLEDAIEGHGGGGSGSSSEKGLPLAIDALDTYTAIDQGVTTWRRRLKLIDPKVAPLDVAPALRQLGAAAVEHSCERVRGTRVEATGSDEKKRVTWCCRMHHVEHDVRSWWVDARLTTGWDEQPWKPGNSCPLCGHRGTLRVSRDAKKASCRECRSTWEDDAQIKLLAAHIRAENGDVGEAKSG